MKKSQRRKDRKKSLNATVIGAGFAGTEAAKKLSESGIHVNLYEMKPQRYSPAHKSPDLCELVCSNSFKSVRHDSAGGLLKEEMKLLGSLCVECAEKCAVPAGGALAVDREKYSKMLTDIIEKDENISVIREEIVKIPDDGVTVIAAGPLVSDALAAEIEKLCGTSLHFFDAVAPIIDADSIDMESAFYQSRYDKGDDDYINCPMNKEEYEAFYKALAEAETAPLHDFDKKQIYEGCMPIEIMAKRGADTMRFGPLKPVGLYDQRHNQRPYAVVQLRRETKDGSMFNMVGFQTNLKFSEQKRVFSMIPALKNAEYLRYGVMHRNTFINSPKHLNADYQFRSVPGLFFAGQITGVEGYMESASSGILAGINAARYLKGENPAVPSTLTMMGALAGYISDEFVENFQPMGANFGLLPKPDEIIKDKRARYTALADRAVKAMEAYVTEVS